jgi:hypothetical protein
MPTKDYVVQEGALFEVSQVQERVELDQVRAEETSKRAEYDQAITDLGNGDTDPEALYALAVTRDERRKSWEDSKSNVERAEAVVAETPLTPTGEEGDDAGTEVVAVEVTVSATEQQL